MLNREKLSGVMYCAVPVVVVADCAVEQMVAEDAIKGFALRRVRPWRRCDDVHALGSRDATGSHQLAVHLHHAGIAGLNGAKLRVVTNMRHFDSATVNQFNQQLSRLDSLWSVV
jgi:hypothetical protein